MSRYLAVPWRALGRLGKADGGAVALEFAIVSMALVMVTLGTIEFGRAYQVRTELTFLVDRAARLILKDWDVTDTAVTDAIRADFDGTRSLLTVTFTRDTETYADGSTVDYRNVAVSYPFRLLIPQLSTNAITLTATERVPET